MWRGLELFFCTLQLFWNSYRIVYAFLLSFYYFIERRFNSFEFYSERIEPYKVLVFSKFMEFIKFDVFFWCLWTYPRGISLSPWGISFIDEKNPNLVGRRIFIYLTNKSIVFKALINDIDSRIELNNFLVFLDYCVWAWITVINFLTSFYYWSYFFAKEFNPKF